MAGELVGSGLVWHEEDGEPRTPGIWSDDMLFCIEADEYKNCWVGTCVYQASLAFHAPVCASKALLKGDEALGASGTQTYPFCSLASHRERL